MSPSIMPENGAWDHGLVSPSENIMSLNCSRRGQVSCAAVRRVKRSPSSRVSHKKAAVYVQDEKPALNRTRLASSPTVSLVKLKEHDKDPSYDSALERADQASQLNKAKSLHDRVLEARSSLAALDPYFRTSLLSSTLKDMSDLELDDCGIDCATTVSCDDDDVTPYGVCDISSYCVVQ